MEDEKLINVGSYIEEFNKLSGSSLPLQEIYCSKGLPTHLFKRNHSDCIKHIDDIPDIISNPDYIGVNPNEPNSIELIKKYEENILIGIKVDVNGDYLYVATMYVIQDAKLDRRLYSGRIKQFAIDSEVLV